LGVSLELDLEDINLFQHRMRFPVQGTFTFTIPSPTKECHSMIQNISAMSAMQVGFWYRRASGQSQPSDYHPTVTPNFVISPPTSLRHFY
jgi:hypothetical protein